LDGELHDAVGSAFSRFLRGGIARSKVAAIIPVRTNTTDLVEPRQMPAAISNRRWYTRWLTVGLCAAAIGASTPAWAADKSWNSGGFGNWSQDAKWTPAGTPGAADAARLGDLPAASGASVFLDAAAEVASLAVSSGVNLNTNGQTLKVNGDVTSSSIASLEVMNSPQAIDFEAGNVTVNANSGFYLGGATAKIHGQLNLTSSDSRLQGSGEIQFTSAGKTFNNNAFDWTVSTPLKLVQQNGGQFDLDGAGLGSTELYLRNGATLTFQGGSLSDPVDAIVVLESGTTLAMNLDSPWTHQFGYMPIVNNQNVAAPAKIAGADFTLSSTWLNVQANSKLEINANLKTAGGTEIWVDATGRLDVLKDAVLGNGTMISTGRVVFHGDTQVGSGGISNFGTLENASTGTMRLNNGANQEQASFENHGMFEVGNSPGMATVEDFTNEADGTWLVEIGGYAAGTQHDLLVVADDAMLGGTLNVALVDLGGGVFQPLVGDEFTILTAGDSLSGAFLADPVSYAAGKIFHWTVLTDADAVTLRLAAITVPEPATYVLAGLGALALAAARRQSSRTRKAGSFRRGINACDGACTGLVAYRAGLVTDIAAHASCPT